MSRRVPSHDDDRRRVAELQREVESLRRTIAHNQDVFRLALQRYVTEEVMQKIASSSDLIVEGERCEITMMFTDLRDSTELSEAMEPEAYISLLNHYLKDMIFIIDSWKGNILEFAGDGIVCIFGAPQKNPDAARSAVYSAVAMQRRMVGINEWNRSQGFPSIQMGIGIHTGEAIVGCIGSETRMKYDAIGRGMNLASRVQDYAAGGQILVTDETLLAVGDEVVLRESGGKLVRPKGVRDEVRLHDVIGMGSLRIP